MSNFLDAIINLKSYVKYNLKDYKGFASNKIQAEGDSLEKFIRSLFIGDFNKVSSLSKEDSDIALNKLFDWLGEANHIPDAILESSDAIEIKKIQSIKGVVPLNSSFPKDYLTPEDLSKNCIEKIGDFSKKDIVYVVGSLKKDTQLLRYLWIVYGNCISADRKVYKDLYDVIKIPIEQLRGSGKYNMTEESKELGRFKEIDPLKRSNMRVRNMFELENPMSCFSSIIANDKKAEFQCFFLCLKSKYENFSEESRNKIEADKNIDISDVQIPDPNNVNKNLEAKLIYFKKSSTNQRKLDLFQ